MRAALQPTGVRIGSREARPSAPRCVSKCVTKGVNALHTSTAARPRQHWVFAESPSPTTRPPRRSSLGWVRVVGLGALSVGVLAGAGGSGVVVQVEMKNLDGDEGREFEWVG